MKIAVVCANGKAGKLIVKEAVDRGLDVTAIVRGENHTACLLYTSRTGGRAWRSELEEDFERARHHPATILRRRKNQQRQHGPDD